MQCRAATEVTQPDRGSLVEYTNDPQEALIQHAGDIPVDTRKRRDITDIIAAII
jgi:hypothetical protein